MRSFLSTRELAHRDLTKSRNVIHTTYLLAQLTAQRRSAYSTVPATVFALASAIVSKMTQRV